MNMTPAVIGTRAVAIALLACVGLCRAAPTDPLEDVQKSSEAWIQTRLDTARAESDWKTERELLTTTLAAYEDRATTEEEKRDFAQAKTAKEREELGALREKAKAAKADLEAGDVALKSLVANLESFRAKLPPHLASGLEFAFRSLRDPHLTTAERMQFTITILTRCAQWDRTLTHAEEIVTVAGKPKALDAIYWGLSHGYALDRKTGQVWLGRPDADQWTWEEVPGMADRVARLIAVFEGKVDPEFVLAPAHVNTAQPPASTP